MQIELLDKKSVAKILKISVVTLDRLRQSGLLQYRKIGGQIRFTQDDIEIFLNKTRVSA